MLIMSGSIPRSTGKVMIKQLLALDGVLAVAKFRDDGALVEGYGLGEPARLQQLAKFAHDYKRMVQGNADQLSMFTQMSGWTPPGGWIVLGPTLSICSVANVVCMVDSPATTLTTVMQQLHAAANW